MTKILLRRYFKLKIHKKNPDWLNLNSIAKVNQNASSKVKLKVTSSGLKKGDTVRVTVNSLNVKKGSYGIINSVD